MRLDVNLHGVWTKEALHERIKKTLPMPDYAGSNLDALYDTLTDIPGELEMAFHEVDAAFDAMPEYMNRFLRMCAALEERYPNLRFWFYR